MSYSCNYCGKIFKLLFNLNRHKKTTKKCLEKRIKIEYTSLNFDCEYCCLKFPCQKTLISHMDKCYIENKELIKKNIILYKEKIKELENKISLQEKNHKEVVEIKNQEIERLSKIVQKFKPTTTNNRNNYITNQQIINYCQNNLAPYKELQDSMKDIIEQNFEYPQFKTINKIASFLINKLLCHNQKNYYFYFDKDKLLRRKDDENTITIDERADKFLGDCIKSMIEKARKIKVKKLNKIKGISKEDNNLIANICSSFEKLNNISERGSSERDYCIRKIKKFCNKRDMEERNKEFIIIDD